MMLWSSSPPLNIIHNSNTTINNNYNTSVACAPLVVTTNTMTTFKLSRRRGLERTTRNTHNNHIFNNMLRHKMRYLDKSVAAESTTKTL